jgi:hypothetical protein
VPTGIVVRTSRPAIYVNSLLNTSNARRLAPNCEAEIPPVFPADALAPLRER